MKSDSYSRVTWALFWLYIKYPLPVTEAGTILGQCCRENLIFLCTFAGGKNKSTPAYKRCHNSTWTAYLETKRSVKEESLAAFFVVLGLNCTKTTKGFSRMQCCGCNTSVEDQWDNMGCSTTSLCPQYIDVSVFPSWHNKILSEPSWAGCSRAGPAHQSSWGTHSSLWTVSSVKGILINCDSSCLVAVWAHTAVMPVFTIST